MSGRGRRLTLIFAAVALALSLGRWGSAFLAERLWEASVSEALAQVGSRRALYALLLELLGVAVSVAWCAANVGLAARIALPDQAPPEREGARLWPQSLSRWWLTIGAVALGVMAGTGAGRWLDEVQLMTDGVRFGLPDPLLGVDLAFFLRDFPFWLHLQGRLLLLVGIALLGVALLHAAGGAVRVTERRLWVSPKARGHLALLLAALALSIAWGAALEPFRLASGLRGPMLSSEFLLRTLMAEVEAGLGAAAAVASLLWWLRVRGLAAVVAWVLFGLSLAVGRVLPLRTELATADQDWRAAVQRLDSVAFALAGTEGPPLGLTTAAAFVVPSLWDAPMLASAGIDSSRVGILGQGWISAAGRPRPVWFGVRSPSTTGAALLAMSDDEVSLSGGALAWREGDSTPSPGARAYREFDPHAVRPGAPSFDTDSSARGVLLDGWERRLVLAWALQHRAALTAPAGTRLGWRLDPLVRLRSAAPFAHWTAPRARPVPGGVLWTSDGLLTSTMFPSSTRIGWSVGTVSMVRPAFLGTVDAATGMVRIYRWDRADSLSAAWSRIARPLIEPADQIPAHLRSGEPYPEDLLLAQVRALEGPGWHVGRVERGGTGTESGALPPMAPGGTEAFVPFVHPVTKTVRAFLLARRTPTGDSLRLIRFDSTSSVDAEAALGQRWARFPFQDAIRDSARAVGGDLKPGRVRHAIAQDGIVAYQPVFALGASGRAHLAMVNVALGPRLGTGRSIDEAWRNLRGEISPVGAGAGAQSVLEAARVWMRHADSALKRGDLQELGRALAYLRDLLDSPRKP